MLITAAVTLQPLEGSPDVKPVCQCHQVSEPPSDFWLHEEINGFIAYATVR